MLRLASDWSRLQLVADRRMALKTLRTGAIGSIIIGALALIAGLLPPAELITSGIGAALVGTGMWNLGRPRPIGVILDGATLILVGAFNVLGSVGESDFGLWAKLGVFQLYWGAQGVLRFKQFRTALAFEPQDTEARAIDNAIRTIEKAKVKESPAAIEFTTTDFHAKLWRGWFTPEGVLLLKLGSHEVILADRHEFDIEPGDKVVIGKNRKASITIKGKTHKGTVSPESLERFQAWKSGVPLAESYAA